MGDLQPCSARPNGVVMGDHPSLSSFLQPVAPPNPDPSSIGEDSWAVAEETTQELLRCIHPTLDSDEKRKDVIDFVQRLIRSSLSVEVFPYGSVPLKTYLPDGDIDLTALSSLNIEESLARDVLAVLQGEEHNENAEYEVKDTQFIDAEVKLVKCLVQNIVIDISFNQLGGLYTLCFLEQVDRLVGKNHLFKRSIILIKAWCYYESRILGAHHGLISTYALETLILYIFHLFHSTLNDPLAVLYRFLDYFSKFDWDNYCISLNGAVCKSSLPDIIVEIPENTGDNFMLSEEFLKNCMDMFSVPSRGLETNPRAFPLKHLNIIDPLKENNNLGRSVHRGNFYRIRSAFKYGARKLGQILLLPQEKLGEELQKFFANTLGRHGRKHGAHIRNPVLAFDAEDSCNLSSSSHGESFYEDEIQLKLLNVDDVDNIALRMEHKYTFVSQNELDGYSNRADILEIPSEYEYLKDGTVVSGYHLVADANDLATLPSSRGLSVPSDCSTPSANVSCYQSLQNYGFIENGSINVRKSSDCIDENMSYDMWLENSGNHLKATDNKLACTSSHECGCSSCSALSSSDADISESLSAIVKEDNLASIAEESDTLNPLSDLGGDYDSHIRSLLYGQCCHGYALSAPVLPNPPFSQTEKPRDTVCPSMPRYQSSCPQIDTNSIVSGQFVYTATNPRTFGTSLGPEDKNKTRGTGTYFPNTNGGPCKEKVSHGRGRKKAQWAQGLSNGLKRRHGVLPALPDTNAHEERSQDRLATSPAEHRKFNGSSRQSHDSNGGSTTATTSTATSTANGYTKLEFGSLGPMTECCNHLSLGTSHTWGAATRVSGRRLERIGKQSYHLEKEDFPPLALGTL